MNIIGENHNSTITIHITLDHGDHVRRNAAAGAGGGQERIVSLLQTMLSRIFTVGDISGQESPIEEQETHLVGIIDQFILDNLASQLTLDDIVSHVGMSRRTFTGQFRQLTGESVMRYVRLVRIERAAELLRNTSASVTEIGTLVGIPESAYFCNCFRRQHQQPPQQYRQQWLSSANPPSDRGA